MSNFPPMSQVEDEVIIHCPDCGQFLFDQCTQAYLTTCLNCGWPTDSAPMIATTDPRLLRVTLANLGPNDPITPPPEPAEEPPTTPQTGGRAGHCANLADCNASSCPTCEPLLTAAEIGESHFAKLHDDPIGFLLQFDSRDQADRESVVVSIAAWGKETAEYVGLFIARSRARAMALGMLGTCL